MGTIEKQEKRSFQLDNNMVFHLIFGQAGSVEKGLLESIMNSVDAGATKVDIELFQDGSGYTIEDDGRGFESREQILEWFEVFGFDHANLEGNSRQLGKFGLGRAQLWSFSRNKWHTNEFHLDVDVKANGLDYTLTETPESVFKGCKIQGEFYDRMENRDLNICVRELERLAKYCAIPVTVNGRLINKPVGGEAWTLETDDAYYKFTSSGSRLAVYNLGVLVREYYSGDYGVSGVVVSKRALSLNIARNDVLSSKCEEWKKIKATMREYALADAGKKPKRMNNERRESLVKEWISGTATYESVSALKLIPTLGGFVSLESLKYKCYTICANRGDPLADYLHSNGDVRVLFPEIIEWVGAFDAAGANALLEAAYSRDCRYHRELSYRPFDELTEGLSRDIEMIPRSQLTHTQLAAQSALLKMSDYVRYAFSKCGSHRSRRVLRVGVFTGAMAWTDGETYIGFSLPEVDAATKEPDKLWELLHSMVHEYAHTELDTEAHAHDLEFYKEFHDVLHHLDVSKALQIGYQEMAAMLKKKKVKVPVWLQKAASKGTKDSEIPEVFEEV